MSKYRKKKYKKRATGGAYKIANKALKLAKSLDKKVGKAELKMVTADLSVGVGVDDIGRVDQLALIAQGVSNKQRLGLSVGIAKIEFIGRLRHNTSNEITSSRVIIFRDIRQAADQKSTPNNFLELLNPYSPYDNKTMSKFMVYYDRFIVTYNPQKLGVPLKFTKYLHFEMRWNGTLSTDIEANGLYIMMISDTSTFTPTLNYNLRVSYYDN